MQDFEIIDSQRLQRVAGGVGMEEMVGPVGKWLDLANNKGIPTLSHLADVIGKFKTLADPNAPGTPLGDGGGGGQTADAGSAPRRGGGGGGRNVSVSVRHG